MTESLQFPLEVMPSFTLGGEGSGTAHNERELLQLIAAGLRLSPVAEVLIVEVPSGALQKPQEQGAERHSAPDGGV